jgi:hypothetical protein
VFFNLGCQGVPEKNIFGFRLMSEHFFPIIKPFFTGQILKEKIAPTKESKTEQKVKAR